MTEPTRRSTVVWAALIGLGAGLVWMLAVNTLQAPPPQVSWATPVLLLAAATAGGFLARYTWRRNHFVYYPAPPRMAVATLAIAKAMQIGGALVGGGYAAIALASVGRLDASAPRERALWAGANVVACVAVIVVGWFLERACRVPEPPEDEADDAEPASGSPA